MRMQGRSRLVFDVLGVSRVSFGSKTGQIAVTAKLKGVEYEQTLPQRRRFWTNRYKFYHSTAVPSRLLHPS